MSDPTITECAQIRMTALAETFHLAAKETGRQVAELVNEMVATHYVETRELLAVAWVDGPRGFRAMLAGSPTAPEVAHEDLLPFGLMLAAQWRARTSLKPSEAQIGWRVEDMRIVVCVEPREAPR